MFCYVAFSCMRMGYIALHSRSNLSATQGEEVEIVLLGKQAVDVAGELLSGGMGDHNTFESPNAVATEQFTTFEKRGENVLLKLPPCSVAHI